jgi:histidinol-phosphate/aromatic aminotransferase/cobyric acid decarboxylase-like protein
VNFDTGDPAVPAAVTGHLHARGVRVRDMTGLRGLAGCVRFTVGDRVTMERVLAELGSFAPVPR